MVLLSVRGLIMVGLWPARGPGAWSWAERLRGAATAGIILLHLGSEAVQLYIMRADLPSLAAMLCIALSGVGSLCKLSNVGMRTDLLIGLVDELEPWVSKRLERHLTLASYSLWLGTTAAWVLAPIVRRDDDLPFLAWFPGAEGAPFGTGPYLASYFFQEVCGVCAQVLTGLVVVTVIAGFDGLFVAMLLALAARLRQVRDALLRGDEPAECVRAHQQALSCLQRLQRAFGEILLLQFASSCFILCTVGFLATLSGVQNAAALVKSVLYLCVAVVQLLLVCLFGELVQGAGASLADAAYASGWEELAQPGRTKALSLLLLRAQRPLVLRAGTVYPVTLRSFASILNSSYSYFALLRTMNE